jgi:hypothetical protein
MSENEEITVDFSKIDMNVEPNVEIVKTGLDLTSDRMFHPKMYPSILKELMEIKNNAVDYVVHPTNLDVMEIDDEHWQIVITTDDGEMSVFDPTNWARDQMIRLTELPKKYHDTLIDNGHINEATGHINMWLKDRLKTQKPKNIQIRTVGEKARAVVSPGYNSFANFDVLQRTMQEIATINNEREDAIPVQLTQVALSETMIRATLVDMGNPTEIPDKNGDMNGDLYYPMVTVKNSEVGSAAFSIDGGVFRYLCSNLHTMGSILRKIHSGARLEEGIFTQETLEKQTDLWLSILRDGIRAIEKPELFTETINGIALAKETPIGSPTTTVKKIGEKIKLSDAEINAIVDAMSNDRTMSDSDRGTLFAVTSGMTQAAKSMGFDRKEEIETLATNVPMLVRAIA